jgi:chemotaxis methyl-accepting protein methylase
VSARQPGPRTGWLLNRKTSWCPDGGDLFVLHQDSLATVSRMAESSRAAVERQAGVAAVQDPSESAHRSNLQLCKARTATRLFDSLLINVTGFFRDPPAWQALREEILPELLSAKSARRPLRVWSAGCATGEEAYTLAIVLVETMGLDEFVSRVKIYATDLDEDALAEARTGVYTERQIAEVAEEFRRKYFEASGSKYAFRRDLRRQVIFGRNDLTRDAPISRVDLLVARNTLMYFNAETQSDIIRKFHFALSNPGFLFLGKAEMLLNHGDQFEPVDLRKRLFRKIGKSVPAEPPRMVTASGPGDDDPGGAGLESAALAAGPVAQLVIDRGGRLVAANVKAETPGAGSWSRRRTGVAAGSGCSWRVSCCATTKVTTGA